jgi:hypothetical protein
MPKQLTRKQREQQAAAAKKRHAKQLAHEAMLKRHAERRHAVAIWQEAFDAWTAADCVGPEPIHPERVTGWIVRPDAGTADLIAAAEELGIDLSGVGE